MLERNESLWGDNSNNNGISYLYSQFFLLLDGQYNLSLSTDFLETSMAHEPEGKKDKMRSKNNEQTNKQNNNNNNNKTTSI